MQVGVTGHQDLGSRFDINWVRAQIEEQVESHKIYRGLSCLAVGADQIFAEILAERKIPLTAVVPCEGYNVTFKNSTDLLNYERLLSAADAIVRLGYSTPTEEAFCAAGKEVVYRSNMILAVWDGEKARGSGGTGDIVAFAKQQKKQVIHINPITKTVTNLGIEEEIFFHE